jgi:FMN phosphatase YigB (HAD superfamily)
LKKYKIHPDEVIFIDDVEKNCIVAQKAWIKSIVAKGPRYIIKEVKKMLKI